MSVHTLYTLMIVTDLSCFPFIVASVHRPIPVLSTFDVVLLAHGVLIIIAVPPGKYADVDGGMSYFIDEHWKCVRGLRIFFALIFVACRCQSIFVSSKHSILVCSVVALVYILARSSNSVSSEMPCTFCIIILQSFRGINGSPNGMLGRVVVVSGGVVAGGSVVVIVLEFVVGIGILLMLWSCVGMSYWVLHWMALLKAMPIRVRCVIGCVWAMCGSFG